VSKTTVASTGIDLSDSFAFTGTVTGTPHGLIRLNGTSGSSGIANVTFDSIFSSSYENYRIIGTHTMSANDAETRMVLRKSSADQEDSYRYAYNEVTRESGGNAQSTQTAWDNSIIKLTVGSSNDTSEMVSTDITVFAPKDATKETVMFVRCSAYRSGNGNWYNFAGGIWTEGSDGQNNDGFKIYPSTGTLTNYKYSVYGILDS